MKSTELNELNYQFKTNINMKTKTSILALTKVFFILLVMCCLFSCETNVKKSNIKSKYMGSEFAILEVDSCEYIMISNDSRSLTHKGNCKYCKERLLKLLK